MKKALLIGINYFNHPKHVLKGCINDIINIRNMLIDAYDYESKNIVMLRDDDPDKYLMPTHENILLEINKIISDSENLEELWIHYSGHGSKIRESKREQILPLDYEITDGIYDDELHLLIHEIKCKAILVFDCCHSGSICEMPIQLEYDSDAENGFKITRIDDSANIITDIKKYVFSSCKDEQTSSDTKNFLDQRVGAFTDAMIECLRNSHHNTDILSLYKNICIYLIKNGYKQTPILSMG
jgi:metacaspase-1